MKLVYSRLFYFFSIICFLSSCSNVFDELLEDTGKSRKELLKVLSHFEEDSLKYNAACFLIRNMKYHTFYDGSELNKYLKYYECINNRHHEIPFIVDSLSKANGKLLLQKLEEKNDLDYIDSNYLIDNIEWAFKVWSEQPWGKNVKFNIFCEYILPYRVGDEVPKYWRKKMYDIYNPMLNSIRNLPEAEDPLFVAQTLLDSLAKKSVTFTELLPSGPHIGPNVTEWYSGTCRELADIVTYIFRAVGIPCAMDYMIRGDNNANHYWNTVISKDQKQYMIEFPTVFFRPIDQYKSPKGKVYRRTFGLNKKILASMDTRPFFVHPNFRNPLFIDVTSQYAGENNRNVTLPKSILFEKGLLNNGFYLCLSRRQQWLPVAWASLDGDSICFPNVEGGVVCCLGRWNGFKFNQCSNPFYIEKNSNLIHYFNPTNELDTIQIYYKYHLYNETYIYRMPGGVFEGSNDKYFNKVDTLFLIEQVPERLYNTVYVNLENKKYRYVRYKGGANSFCNIAEIEFYDSVSSLLPLSGIAIGTSGCWQGDGSHEYTMAFDSNPYTSFDYVAPSSGWTGLDLIKPYQIKKIRYVPRNRDNFIRKGDNYELFYWNNKKWNSTGIIQAQADSLVCIVPKSALLYLKNHSRGKDERIFEYRNNKMKFW